nr:MAG TPA: hypothetical protein [Caudoviricetes sp.]
MTRPDSGSWQPWSAGRSWKAGRAAVRHQTASSSRAGPMR